MPKNMLQAVIDTNILVRSILKKGGSDSRLLKAFLDEKFLLFYSEKTISELDRVLNYSRIYKKYNLNNEIIADFINAITTFGKLVYKPKKVKICKDLDDDELISIAQTMVVGNNSVYLVSGDNDLLVLKEKIKGIKIVTASEFVRILKYDLYFTKKYL